ncbi:hypothetical protein TUM19329_11210 [Legionella antarctica]|uniref:Fido domain-containing protein n=1 Tax=Legionella antarctica TaxID=2708020 RepID=A0A6F8T3M6_9GAMM|nr:Fic family protein [Legionella antarctica]BCA94760.1 hypothetical protein TUM19329_11210 [Legionella antarctica]
MYHLEELSEFPHALIYAFEPESSPQRLAGSHSFKHALFPEAGQHEDMLQAYLYAQNTILPLIRERGLDKIDEKMFLEWINTLHGLIGKSLFANYPQKKAGEYTSEQILRWHKGAQLNADIVHYLSGYHPCNNMKDFAKFLQEQGVAVNVALPFIKLLHKLKSDKTIKPHPSQLPFIDLKNPVLEGIMTLNKMVVVYHNGNLTVKEKEVVDQVVKVCRFPHEIPDAMQVFAQETLQQLRNLEKENLPEIANFLGTLFYQFTDIHPFGNANGRTGTCLVNIVLRAFDLPGILLRHPGENCDEGSDYSKAIAQLDKTLVPLQTLILKRIETAKESTFVDEQLKQIVSLRVSLSDLLKQIQKKHPKYDIEPIQHMLSESVLKSLSSVKDINTASIIVLTEILQSAANEEKRLDDARKIKALLPTPVSPTEKQALIHAFEQLTGMTGWKSNSSNGLVVWLELKDKSTAATTASGLQKLNAATVTLANRSDNGMPVIQCKLIDIKKIIDMAAKLQAEEHDSGLQAVTRRI